MKLRVNEITYISCYNLSFSKPSKWTKLGLGVGIRIHFFSLHCKNLISNFVLLGLNLEDVRLNKVGKKCGKPLNIPLTNTYIFLEIKTCHTWSFLTVSSYCHDEHYTERVEIVNMVKAIFLSSQFILQINFSVLLYKMSLHIYSFDMRGN